MRIPSKSDRSNDASGPVPTEVQIWLDRGWVIIPSERRGYVISGDKKMRNLDKVGLAAGVLLLVGFAIGYMLPGVLGVLLIAASWLDFQYNTKPQTKFFPEVGEQSRLMDRG